MVFVDINAKKERIAVLKGNDMLMQLDDDDRNVFQRASLTDSSIDLSKSVVCVWPSLHRLTVPVTMLKMMLTSIVRQ